MGKYFAHIPAKFISALAVWAVLLLALMLRLYRLDSKLIWFDEAISISAATHSIHVAQDVEVVYKPLYFIFLRAWIGVVGDLSPFYMRLPSVIFGVVSIYFLFLLCERIADRKTGLLAAFFMAISPFHIYNSQQVVQFTLLTMWVVISFYLLVLYLQQSNLRYCVLNLLANVALLYTYPTGVFVLFVQILIVAIRLPRHRWFWILFSIVSMISLVLSAADAAIVSQGGISWMPHPSWSSLKETLSTFVTGGPDFGLNEGSLYSQRYLHSYFTLDIESLALVIVLPLFVLGFIRMLLRGGVGWIVPAWMVIVYLAMCVSYYFFFPLYVVKHLIIIAPAFYISTAYGCSSLRNRHLYALAVVGSIFVTAAPAYAMYKDDLHLDWRQPAALVREFGRKGDVVVLCTQKEVSAFMYFFRPPSPSAIADIGYWGKWDQKRYLEVFTEQGFTFVLIKDNDVIGDLASKETFFDGASRIWLCVSKWTTISAKDGKMHDGRPFLRERILNLGFDPILEGGHNGVSTTLFRREVIR